MALFKPTNNVRTDTNDNVFINVNRYQKKTKERRGFLRNEVQQNTVAAASRPAALRADTEENRNRLLTTANTQQMNAPAATIGSSLMNRAVQQYQNLQLGVKNTTDLLNRGIDVYQKTRNLAPALMNIPQPNAEEGGQFGIEIPQTMNTIRSNGIAQYLILNATAEKNTNPYDLYLKAGPMRMLETQLFI